MKNRNFIILCLIGIFTILGINTVMKRQNIPSMKSAEELVAGDISNQFFVRKERIADFIYDFDPTLSEEYIDRIVIAAMKTSQPELIIAITLRESSFNKSAISHKGAKGLTGIIPRYWHKALKKAGIIRGMDDYYKIEQNLAACDFIMNTLMSEYPNKRDALRFYNGGHAGLRWKVCARYADDVLEYERQLKNKDVYIIAKSG